MKSKKTFLLPIVFFLLWEVVVWAAAARWTSGSTFMLVGLISTAFGLVALVAYLAIARLLMRRAPGAAETPHNLSTPSDRADRSPADTAPLSDLVREADRRLSQSLTLSRNAKSSLYDLPVYILAGAPGTGKTTAFLAADLSSELLAGQVHRETTVLPTSLCNLWYAAGSVFVEAGGRFFTEDIRQWHAFTEQLCGGRRSILHGLTPGKRQHAGVKGLIWFCDITLFLGATDPGRISNLARKVQERLLALAQSLGSSFPVYVVFTKADNLPHFEDFFRRLPENEDRQVFGVTLPASDLPERSEVYADAQTKRLLELFNALYLELADKRLPLLARETARDRKGGIYEFPREVKRIRDSLLQFLVESFRPNPLQPSPLLRGFYFSGMRHVPATAAAASFTGSGYSPKPKTFDATVLFQAKTSPSEATASTLRPDSAETLVERWAFLADLFQKIVLRDPLSQVAAVRNVRRDHRARFLFAGVAVAALLLTGCFTISWLGNLRLLSNVQRGAQIDLSQVPKDGLPALQDLRSLDALRQALTPLAEYRQKGAPWRLRWGLYTGDRVFPRAYEAYFQLFQLYFLTRTENAFSGDLQSLGSLKGSHSYDGIYDTLKAYRMTTSGECKPDAAFLAPVFFHSWQGEQLLDADRIKLAKQQVQFYAAELTRKNPYQLAENPQLIQNGRQALAGFGGVDRLLRGLLEAANQLPRRTVRVADLSPNFRDVLTGPGEVQAAFTSDAWSYVEQKLRQSGQFSLGEACVVGAGASAAGYSGGPEVMAQLNTLYVREYIQVWRKFLASTAVQPFRSPADAARSLGLLADNRSPLLAVLFLTAENTNLVPTPSSNAALSTLPVSAKHPHSREAASAEPGAEFARIFQPVRQAVQVGDRDRLIGDLNRGYVNALGEMQQAMERLAHDSSSNPDFSLHQQAQAAFEKGLDSVRLIAQRFNINGSEGVDTEVKRLLESPFRDCSKFIITDPSKVGRDKILAAAKDFCRRLSAIAHTFPFDPTSDTDATSEQVTAVFAPPAGALFSLEQQLGKTMERQGSYWVQNPDASDLKLSPGFLAFLNHMQAISEGLFSGGSSQLNMQYSLTPLPSLEGESISVAIDGQKLNSAGGESTPTLFSWPGKADQQGVLIRVKAGANIPFASYEGLWSIFRLLDDADPRLPGSRIVEISKVRRGHGRPESVLDENDKPIKVRLQLPDLNGKPDVFEKNFFDIHCPAKVLE